MKKQIIDAVLIAIVFTGAAFVKTAQKIRG